MAAFITGGNGFVGRFLVEWLSANQPDERLYCLVRNLSASGWMAAYPNIIRIEGDLLSPETYRPVVKDVERVYHLAAKLGLRNGQEFYEQNALATERLVDALQSAGTLSRLVFVSSIAAVDRDPAVPATGPLTAQSRPCPGSDYGKSKLMAEDAVRKSGLPYTILRPAYIYGGRTRKGSSVDVFLRDILSGKPYTTIPFPGRVSAIEVRDLAQAIHRAAKSPLTVGRTYFAADSSPLPVSRVIQTAAEVLGIPFNFRKTSQNALRRLQAYCYARSATLVIAKILFEDAFYCDSSPLWQDLAWEPSIPQETGIRRALLAYRNRE